MGILGSDCKIILFYKGILGAYYLTFQLKYATIYAGEQRTVLETIPCSNCFLTIQHLGEMYENL